MSTTCTAPRDNRLWLQLMWWIVIALWTVALLTPYPIRIGQRVLPPGTGSPLCKALHIVAYAVLTGAIPWLRPGGRRWWLLAFVSFHAAATEFFQQFVPERTGTFTDVGINHIGILLGLLAWWWAANRLRPLPGLPRHPTADGAGSSVTAP